MKNKKSKWVFVFQKYGKFWSISLEHSIKHKPPISDKYAMTKVIKQSYFNFGICCSLLMLSSLSQTIWEDYYLLELSRNVVRPTTILSDNKVTFTTKGS